MCVYMSCQQNSFYLKGIGNTGNSIKELWSCISFIMSTEWLMDGHWLCFNWPKSLTSALCWGIDMEDMHISSFFLFQHPDMKCFLSVLLFLPTFIISFHFLITRKTQMRKKCKVVFACKSAPHQLLNSYYCFS